MLNLTALRVCVAIGVACVAFAIMRGDVARAGETAGTSLQAGTDDVVSAQIRRRISTAPREGDLSRDDWNALVSFYSERHGAPVWVSVSGLSERGQQAIAEIRRADDWGLASRAFDLPQVGPRNVSPQELAAAEIKIGLAVLKYARFARGARVDPSRLSPYLDQAPNLRDPKRILREIGSANGADAYLRSLHPKHPQFKLLREALIRGRGRQAGMDRSAPRSIGPLSAGSPDDIRRIIVNMERWRWMPDDLGEFYIWDNVPEFVTRVVRNGKVIHLDKIIVGKPSTPTPVFSARLQYVVFHPEWAVPDSIKVNEILPHLRNEPGFFGIGAGVDTSILRQHSLRVMYNGNPVDPAQVDWARVDIRQFQFLQAPSDRNVLGTLKFRFPNKHDVYMHDTPERNLFGRPVRALSHGCMRVQDPRRLAEILLAHDKNWSASEVANLLATGNNTEVELTRKIPVHVTYFTAIASDDGRIQYFGDLYGHDNLIGSALDGRPLRSAVPLEVEDARASRRPAPRGGLEELFSVLLGF